MENGRNAGVPAGVRRDTITIALDAEGGDHAPEETVAGALEAASPELRILLVGRPEKLDPHLEGEDRENIEVVPSRDVIGYEEDPARAVRRKEESSVVVGARAVAEGRAQGLVSSGSTGAMLAAGLLIVRRVEGVKRPAILTVLPGLEGPVVFLDAGANADCRAEHLVEFGVLGAVFAREVLGIREPRVALLNIGEESTKGNAVVQEAYKMMCSSALRFTGNVEGGELFYDAADVVVTD